MSVAKGQIQPDKSYRYTCGNCRGHGLIDGITCPHCYDLDMIDLLAAFGTARGERYYAILKTILKLQGKAIYERAIQLKAQGKFTAVEIGVLVLEFNFPENRVKPLLEWLDECGAFQMDLTHTWESRSFTVAQMLAAARVKLATHPGAES
jgi:hypothetical protein